MLDIQNLDLLTINAICKKLKVSRSTLARWIENKRNKAEGRPTFPLPCMMMGSQPRWQLSVVNAWLNNATQGNSNAIDFAGLVEQIITDAKKVHQVYGGLEEELAIFITGPSYKECDAIRSLFPEGSGNVLDRSHIGIYFLPDDVFAADNLRYVHGRAALRVLRPKNYLCTSLPLMQAIRTSLVMAATSVEKPVTKLMIDVIL